jgi:uroporphyrinogen decarboxylase
MSTGVSMFAYWNLREYLGLPTDSIWIPDMVQGLAYVDDDILRRFHCDLMLLEPCYADTARWNPRGRYAFTIPRAANPQPTGDGGWIIHKDDRSMRMPPNGHFFDGAWLKDWGEGTEDERIALYARKAERIFKETDYATMFVGYSHGIGAGAYGGGSFENALLAYEAPEALREAREKQLANNLRRMGKVIDAFGPCIQLVAMADDMGIQSGPTCSPQYLEEFCFPYYKRFCDFVHAHSDIKVFLHNCGSIKPLIPMLIEAGVDALNRRN